MKKNIAYNLIYQLFIYIVPLITTPYLSRTLGASGVGEYSFTYSVTSYFTIFGVLGLANYGNREISRVSHIPKERSKTFWSIFSMQIITSSISAFVYFIYAFIVTEPTVIKSVMIFYVISAVFDISWFYFGMELFKITILKNGFLKLSSCLLIFIYVKGEGDVWIYGTVIAISSLLSQLVLWINIKKYVGVPRFDVSDFRVRIVPNFKLFIPVAAVSIYKIMDKIMLGLLSSHAQVGYYESSERLTSIPVCFVTALGTVMLPRISNMLSKEENNRIRPLTEKSLVIATATSSLICFGMMGVMNEFIPLFYGTGFDACKEILWVLLPSTIFVAQANVVRTQILIPYAKDNIYIISVVLGAVTNCASNILLIPKLGATGAAAGTLLAEFSVWIFQDCFVLDSINVFHITIKCLPVVAAGAGMAFLLDYLSIDNYGYIVSLVIKAIIGGIVFCTIAALYFYGLYRRHHGLK